MSAGSFTTGSGPGEAGASTADRSRTHVEVPYGSYRVVEFSADNGEGNFWEGTEAVDAVDFGVESGVGAVALLDEAGELVGAGVTSCAAPRAGVPERLRVLVVEDVQANQMLLQYALEKAGHEVNIAADGRRALELAADANFDLVLMDVQLPEMDGYQATAALRDLPGHAQTPIVALTAHAMPGDRERCLAAGMDDYLAKPIDLRELAAVLARHAGHPRGARADG